LSPSDLVRDVADHRGRVIGYTLRTAGGYVAYTKATRLGVFGSDLEAERCVRAAPKRPPVPRALPKKPKEPPRFPSHFLTAHDEALAIRQDDRLVASVEKGKRGRYIVRVGGETIGDFVTQDEARARAYATLMRQHRS
jgi:hypothetical protein